MPKYATQLLFLLMFGWSWTACDSSAVGPPSVVQIDGTVVPPADVRDTAEPRQDTEPARDLAAPDTLTDIGETPDLGADSGGAEDTGCTWESPLNAYPAAAGALSSYSRAAAHPSAQQWTDRARAMGLRAVFLADHQRRTANALPVDQFSDSNPDAAVQWAFRFDAAFNQFENEEENHSQVQIITKEDDPELTFDPGIRLLGAEDGFALARYVHPDGFDFDRQDAVLQVRVKVTERREPSRAVVRVAFGLPSNTRQLDWIVAYEGEPGEGVVAGNATDSFKTYYLEVKDRILEDDSLFDPPAFWTEGVVQSVEVRVEGEMTAVFDHTRLNTDAWFDDYRSETAEASTSQVRIIPGVEHYFDSPLGQFNCVGPASFPASDSSAEDHLMEDLAAAGCLVAASRPLGPGAGMSAELVQTADIVEVWHSLHREGIDTAWWDELLASRGAPFPAIAAAYLAAAESFTDGTPRNVLLAENLSEEALVSAMAAGRLYMTNAGGIEAELWAEGTDCQRIEMGETASGAEVLHGRIDCTGGTESATLIHVALPSNDREERPLADAAAGATWDVSDWAPGYVRLEGRCVSGALVFTNPIWLQAR